MKELNLVTEKDPHAIGLGEIDISKHLVLLEFDCSFFVLSCEKRVCDPCTWEYLYSFKSILGKQIGIASTSLFELVRHMSSMHKLRVLLANDC